MSDTLELGDRIAYGTVELIVRRTDDEHGVTDVGLAVEQQIAKPKRNIPIFQSRSELLSIWKDWQKRRRDEKNAARTARLTSAPTAQQGKEALAAPDDAPDDAADDSADPDTPENETNSKPS